MQLAINEMQKQKIYSLISVEISADEQVDKVNQLINNK